MQARGRREPVMQRTDIARHTLAAHTPPSPTKKGRPKGRPFAVIGVDGGDQKLIFVPTVKVWMSLTPEFPAVELSEAFTPVKPVASSEKFL